MCYLIAKKFGAWEVWLCRQNMGRIWQILKLNL